MSAVGVFYAPAVKSPRKWLDDGGKQAILYGGSFNIKRDCNFIVCCASGATRLNTTYLLLGLWYTRRISGNYEPEKPLIDSPTLLKFSVQNLQTGQHLKDLLAKVTIINRQTVFKSNNITVTDGDFSFYSTFANDGAYQVIFTINSKDYAIALASFKVIVPFQPIGTINLSYTIPLILPAVIVGIVGFIVVATFLIVKRIYEKKGSQKSGNNITFRSIKV
jgi:hypothetical protein